jgi:hypothetical protein
MRKDLPLGMDSAILLAGSKINFDKQLFGRQNCGFRVGGIPKWPTGSDCKSDGSAFEGSNPSPSTKNVLLVGSCLIVLRVIGFAGVAQW